MKAGAVSKKDSASSTPFATQSRQLSKCQRYLAFQWRDTWL